MMDWNGIHEWGYMHGFGWLFMILFWGLIVAVILFGFRAFYSTSRQIPTNIPKEKTAMEILDDRFARGEIDIDEYEKRRKALQNHS